MNKLKQKYLALTTEQQRAFWAILTIAISTTVVVFVLSLGSLFHPSKYWYTRIAEASPIFLAAVSFLSVYWIITGHVKRGSRVFVAFLTYTLLLMVAGFVGVGYAAAALAIVLSSYIGMQILRKRDVVLAPLFGLVLGAIILLGDAYVPWPRDSFSLALLQNTTWIATIIMVLFVLAIAQQFRSFPLSTKLVLISLFITIVPAAALGVMSSINATRALEQDANKSLLTSASQVAASIDSFISYNLDNVRVEAQTIDFVQYLEMSADVRSGSDLEARVTSDLRYLRQRDNIYIQSYALVALVDGSALVVADTDEKNIGARQSDQMYYIEAMNTGLPYVSPVLVNQGTSDSVIIFSAPVRNALGATVGVLKMTYRADVLQLLLAQQGIGEGINSLLVDDNYILLADRNYPDLMRKSIQPLDESQLMVLQRLGVLPENQTAEGLSYDVPDLVNGLKKIDVQPNFMGELDAIQMLSGEVDNQAEQAAAVRTSTRPWYVVAMQSRKELLAPVETLTRGITALGVLTAFVGVILAAFVSQLIARPIESLSQAATRLAEGDLSVQATVNTDDEVGQLAKAFNNMSAQVAGLINSLEQRVSERTRALSTSTEVSRHLSTILDEGELVKEVVEQLQKAFDYYHVHIYLWDANQDRLVMVGGTGDAGKTMLERGHQISKGRGLVGRAAESGVPVLVSDVSKADGWLPNPLLPYTRCEMAVPILSGDQVLGVLDVQDDEVGELQQSDADLLQSIANQVGIGLLNARSYKETQRRAQREAMVAAIGQRILQTTSTEEALQVAVREVGRALGKPNTTVRLNARSENGQMDVSDQRKQNNGHENG